MRIDLRGDTALVTGAARGIGAAIARRLSEAGARVWIHHHASEADARSLAAELPGAGIVKADLADENQVAELARRVRPVTLLVNNAGVWEDNPIGDRTSFERYRRLMRINLDSAYLLVHLLVEDLKLSRRGAILNITSRAGKRGEPQAAHYAMSKGAMHAMTVSLARELAPWSVRVNAVAPGWVDTPMTAAHLADPDVRRAAERQTLLGRVGTPDDIASAAVWLLSPLASYVTGQVLHVNGGSYLNA